jgi:hypothetical protein
MINEKQNVQMQHRIFGPDFFQLPMDRLLPVFDQDAHELERRFCSGDRRPRHLT